MSPGDASEMFRVVPGERFGSITATVSQADLARIFGSDNVREERVQCAEGLCEQPGTVVKVPGCPETMRVFWLDTVALRSPSRVEAALDLGQYGDSALRGCWKTDHGLGIGTTSRDLEAFNQGPFQLEPLGEWDYAGYAGPWLGGRLATLFEPASGPRMGVRVDFLSGGTLNDAELATITKPRRDSLRSDEPLLRKLNPRVVALWMTFEAKDSSTISSVDSADGSRSNDWLIVPGVRVGPITAHSSEADLKTRFGPDQVTRDSVFWFEGEYRPATILFSRDPTHRLAVVWRDEATWSIPKRIDLEGGHSVWHTSEGISLGSTVEELERLNGKPFRITSADHDYGGLAWSWEGGALEAKLQFLELRVENRIFSDQHHPFSSDSTVRAARASVSLMYVYFPE